MDEMFRHEPANKARKLTGNDSIINVGGVNVEASNCGFTVDGYTVYAQRTALGISVICAKKGEDVITLGDIVGKELAPYSKLYLVTSRPSERMQPEGLRLTIKVADMSYDDTSNLTDPRNFTSKYLRTVFNGDSLKDRVMAKVKSEFARELAISHSRLRKKAEQAAIISGLTGVPLPDNWPRVNELALSCYNGAMAPTSGLSVGPIVAFNKENGK